METAAGGGQKVSCPLHVFFHVLSCPLHTLSVASGPRMKWEEGKKGRGTGWYNHAAK